MNAYYSLALLLASPVLGQSISIGDFSTFPHVPMTASINGFADPIYAELPSCAQNCVKESTGNTPCPYWDTGCLCIMPQWIDPVADCFAQNCKGVEASSASYLASSLCHSVGAWWGIAASDSTSIAEAIADTTAAAAGGSSKSTAAATPTQGTVSAVSSANAQGSPAATGSTHHSESAAPTSAAKSSSKASVAAAKSSSGASAPSLNRNGATLTGVAAMGAVVAVLAHAL